MRIYFVGSHSVGKTTCARWVSSKYNIPMVPEVARQVMAEMELSLERIRVDSDLINQYQKRVLERQIQAESMAGTEYVSDRAFDCLAYTAEHATNLFDLMSGSALQNYVAEVKLSGTVFFVRPYRSLATVDGVRETPEWDGLVRIDGMIKFMLEMWGVSYTPLCSPSMQERIYTISNVLRSQPECKHDK